MVDLHCVALKAQAGLAEQFGRHREITLCCLQIDMTKIGGQLGQKILYVGTAAIPGDDPVNSSRMTKVMQTRLVTRSALATNTREIAQSAKCALHRVFGQRLAVAETEERSLVGWRMAVIARCSSRCSCKGLRAVDPPLNGGPEVA